MPVSARGAKIFFILILLLSGLRAQADGDEGDCTRLESSLKRDVEFLSDSLCCGRKTGSQGANEAAFYIIRRLVNLGYDVQTKSFSTTGDAVGHNILAGSIDGKKPAILLMAYYDGLGKMGGRLYPGADSNGSGAAALLAIAEKLKERSDVIIAFVDGHNANMAGSEELAALLAKRPLRMVVNLDILGSSLAPPDKFWKNYLIILGGSAYQRSFDKLNSGKTLHLYYNYYNSRSFTDLFYRKVGDQKPFFSRGVPVLMFTSGITLNTNREGDTSETLDYPVFAERVSLITRWLQAL